MQLEANIGRFITARICWVDNRSQVTKAEHGRDGFSVDSGWLNRTGKSRFLCIYCQADFGVKLDRYLRKRLDLMNIPTEQQQIVGVGETAEFSTIDFCAVS